MSRHTPDGRAIGTATMRIKSASLLLAVPLLLAALGCSAAANRRIGRDALVAAASPVQIPFGGVVDACRVYRHDPRTLFAFPVVLLHHTTKHAVVSVLHAGDILLYPIAASADWEPITLYDTDAFPFRVPNKTARQVMGRFYVFATATPAGAALMVYSYRAWFDIFHKWDWHWGHNYHSLRSYVYGLGTLTGAFLVGYGCYAPFNDRLDGYLGRRPLAAMLEAPEEGS